MLSNSGSLNQACFNLLRPKKPQYILWTIEEHVYYKISPLRMVKENKQAPVNKPRSLLKQNQRWWYLHKTTALTITHTWNFFFLQKVTYSNWNKTQCITCNNTSYSIKCSDKVINSAVFTGMSFTSWASPSRNVVMDFSTVLLSMWFQLVILFKWPTLSKDYSQLNQAPKEHLWRQKRDVSQDVCPTNYVKGLKETRCNIRVKQ